MKSKIMTLLIVCCLLFTNYSFVMAQTIKSNDVDSIEADVYGCNVTFEVGTSESIKLSYYGTASNSIYDLKTSITDGGLKIDLDYIGKGIAPTIKEGGVVVKIPDKDIRSLNIIGEYGAGITLNNVNIDTNLETENSAVSINNDKAENKITIDSKDDSYEIVSAPPTKDFNMKAYGCAIEYKLSKIPDNLQFKLTNNKGYVEIPKDWSYDFSIGSGKPKMVIENVDGSFELYY